MWMLMYKRLALPISYSQKKRSKKDVEAIVIHYTGNNYDDAEGNVNFFSKNNARQAGAHFFVDQEGNIGRSIPINRVAWAVGGDYREKGKGGQYYGIYTNHNTVSIELCDCKNKDASPEQIKAVKKLVKYIRRWCPNAKAIIRHYDVNGKICPARLIDESKWRWFKKQIGG